ncbi:hypothetical protein O181_104693 [Austropuccinia psidii MF-1]|uniref:Uncharacterized protein n=1 Tax=Austropuccinia psidii MF-1 TaxID=1389203 RepID=A0A9Q3PK90_9BASI|nr:hypothetical protein [Austropuccinia psidii MF-1]
MKKRCNGSCMGACHHMLCPGSLIFAHKSFHWSRIPTLNMQILTLVQDPNASHAKPCAVNAYTRTASRQCRQFLTLFQLPMLHTQILTLVQVPNNSNNSLRQGSLPTIQNIPYAGAGSQPFTCKS